MISKWGFEWKTLLKPEKILSGFLRCACVRYKACRKLKTTC